MALLLKCCPSGSKAQNQGALDPEANVLLFVFFFKGVKRLRERSYSWTQHGKLFKFTFTVARNVYSLVYSSLLILSKNANTPTQFVFFFLNRTLLGSPLCMQTVV